MATILVYSSSEAGHTFPLVPGLTALAARGHDIQMRVTGKHVMSMREAGFAAAPVDPRIEDVEVTDYKAKSGGDRLRQGVRDLLLRGDIEIPRTSALASMTILSASCRRRGRGRCGSARTRRACARPCSR